MRVRALAVVAGLGALLAGLPVRASAPTEPVGDERPVSAASVRALGLLQSAARAARTRAWSGTQHVVSVRDGQPRFTVLQVSHRPGAGSAVHVLSAGGGPVDGVVVADAPDARMLQLLAEHYDLSVSGATDCLGHPSYLVEARRPGVTGPGALAGRYWVDRTSRLVLRREVLDEQGDVVRSSAFVSLQLGAAAAPTAAGVPMHATGELLSETALQGLQAKGWRVQRVLPGGMELFEARLHEQDVLQLSYSDGLSSMSLFAQRGEPADEPDGTARPVGDGTVWVSQGSPERVVWAGEGHTWTLVTDASSATVSQTVLALPHRPSLTEDDGLARRVWRGMGRVGAWLNPFS